MAERWEAVGSCLEAEPVEVWVAMPGEAGLQPNQSLAGTAGNQVEELSPGEIGIHKWLHNNFTYLPAYHHHIFSFTTVET